MLICFKIHQSSILVTRYRSSFHYTLFLFWGGYFRPIIAGLQVSQYLCHNCSPSIVTSDVQLKSPSTLRPNVQPTMKFISWAQAHDVRRRNTTTNEGAFPSIGKNSNLVKRLHAPLRIRSEKKLQQNGEDLRRRSTSPSRFGRFLQWKLLEGRRESRFTSQDSWHPTLQLFLRFRYTLILILF